MVMRSNTILASTFGWDIADIAECRYQRYVSPVVYSVGEQYFAVSKTKPKHKDVGGEWRVYSDQFFAKDNGTVVWVCGGV